MLETPWYVLERKHSTHAARERSGLRSHNGAACRIARARRRTRRRGRRHGTEKDVNVCGDSPTRAGYCSHAQDPGTGVVPSTRVRPVPGGTSPTTWTKE